MNLSNADTATPVRTSLNKASTLPEFNRFVVSIGAVPFHSLRNSYGLIINCNRCDHYYFSFEGGGLYITHLLRLLNVTGVTTYICMLVPR